MPMPKIAVAAATLVLAGLSACDRKPADSTEALDRELVNGIGGNAADPALAGALGKRIVVDPARVAGKRAGAAPVADVRQADARSSGVGTMSEACRRELRYDARWAGRLPPVVPVYPAARLAEAAGTDVPGCRMRIVSFASADPVAKVVAFYRARATGAGYSSEEEVAGREHVVAGTRGDAAYYLTIAPTANGGSSVDLVANHGG